MKRSCLCGFSRALPILFVLACLIPTALARNPQDSGRSSTPAAAPDTLPTVPPAVISRAPDGSAILRATRILEPLKIDGRLEEPPYGNILAASDFLQQDPDEGAPATEKTEVWTLYDDKNIYIAARCHDSQMPRLVANELRRDSYTIYQNDNFAVILDTFNDRRNGFLFYTNPVGGLADSYVTEERESNRDWNTVWEVRTQKQETSWTVEMAIPFKSLRYRPGNPQVWGINFRRIIRWKNEHDYLTQIPRSYGGRGIQKVSSAATLMGIEAPSEGANVEIKPYALGMVNTDLSEQPPISNKPEANAGVDAKYGLTAGLTADFTYRTDFAQVEDDEQQVNLSRFNLFFPEKRDFFLEGAGIFTFGGSARHDGGLPNLVPIMFYSRRIGLNEEEQVPIIAGGRITGRMGAFSIGALDIQTQETPEALAPSTNFAVLRAKRNILKRSSIGIIGTGRTRLSTDTTGGNSLLGFDGSFVFYENLHIDTYYARTWTGGAKGKDSSYRAALDYSGDRYGFQLEHMTVGDNFQPEIGFLRRENFRRDAAAARFSPRPKSMPSIRRFNYSGAFDNISDTQGRLESRQAELSAGIEFERGDRWGVSYEQNREVLREEFELSDEIHIPVGDYGFGNLRTSYSLGPQRKVSGWANFSIGGFYGGTRKEVGFNGRVEINYKFSLEPGISLNWVDTPWGSYTPNLITARVNYALSARIFFGALIQYNSGDNLFGTNLRFRWEYSPGSDLYVVYSDGRNTELSGMPRLETRSIAVKFTRLFRF